MEGARVPAPSSALSLHPHCFLAQQGEAWRHRTSRVSCLPGLASVEAYSYKTNEWFFVAPMNTRRSSVGVGVVEGKEPLWVVAGALACSFCHCSESAPSVLM